MFSMQAFFMSLYEGKYWAKVWSNALLSLFLNNLRAVYALEDEKR